ncbi:Aldo/keto reductase [Mytilinidion resinicola]|uniref:Aldo/keto reductase n=1 Tax=Mytilinidion resinicola TaxID=574789 RepID=A0A6A6Y1A9_9PEZI|nr:Aldo/keto reductase [Mytilinidion resinicola]KAF2801794.1 Aldo/keto reductase [Mytilinidion resinicola]
MAQRAAPNSIAGKRIGPTGYGLMWLTRPWDITEYADATKVMKTALEQGANFWNGGMFYGPPNANSLQLGAYDRATNTPTGSTEEVRSAVEEAVRVLDGAKKIDIFQCARVDPKVPVETTIKALAELVAAGKIGNIGVSEVSGATLRRAHAVHPIAAVEIELSLFSTEPLANGIVHTCHELGVPIVAYSPLSRGWLTGQYRRYEDLPEAGAMRFIPRFQPDVFDQNLKLVEAIEALAKRKGTTVPQVAIAWVRRQGAIPIPGATKVDRVVENCAEVALTEEELREIQEILDTFPIQGQRYGGEHEALLNQ